jgi:hypothetical protein
VIYVLLAVAAAITGHVGWIIGAITLMVFNAAVKVQAADRS